MAHVLGAAGAASLMVNTDGAAGSVRCWGRRDLLEREK